MNKEDMSLPGPVERSGGVREPAYVRAAIRGLTEAQRKYVRAGYIGGDCSNAMIRTLQRKALFYLHIDSPNGRCGTMRLTPLGVTVQAIIRERSAIHKARRASTPDTTGADLGPGRTTK
jgi:hypothetical protein